MKYPEWCKNVIDVTQAPYFADNTGKTDCTAILCRVLDDILGREAEGFRQTVSKMESLPSNAQGQAYIGFEDRKYIYEGNVEMDIIFPETVPASRIIYFPAGTYLVSDTVGCSLDLKNYYHSKPFCQLARGLHFLGESKESVTVRLADNSKGFEAGKAKPVISYIAMKPDEWRKEITNVAQMNTFSNITVDCGKGNPGAVGLLFVSSNSGRIEKASFRSEGSQYAIHTAFGSEGVAENIEISGFEYGVRSTDSSPMVWEHVTMEKIGKAGFLVGGGKTMITAVKYDAKLLEFLNGYGVCFADGVKVNTDCTLFENVLYVRDGNEVKIFSDHPQKPHQSTPWDMTLALPEFPGNPRPDFSDWCCVDDFGAKGDGVTDSTQAVQDAMNSVKSVILFGEGHYLLDGEIKIPRTVCVIDFMFCDLFAGEHIKKDKNAGLFVISEDSENLLSVENLYTFEQLHGHFRLIRHSAKRNLLCKDLHTQTLAMYFNTVGGSTVYFDNCACTTGTYSQDAILRRIGMTPEFCGSVPYEFHGQTVFAKNLNPERADVEVLNDSSVFLAYGLKCEGPGTMLKTVNGGKSEAVVLSAGIGKTGAENALFETENATLGLYGLCSGGFPPALLFGKIVSENGETVLKNDDLNGDLPNRRLLVSYHRKESV